jgi:hypothetical protein
MDPGGTPDRNSLRNMQGRVPLITLTAIPDNGDFQLAQWDHQEHHFFW